MPGKGEIAGRAVFNGLWDALSPQERQQDPRVQFLQRETQRVPPPRACWGSEPCMGMCRYHFFCDLCGVWARE